MGGSSVSFTSVDKSLAIPEWSYLEDAADDLEKCCVFEAEAGLEEELKAYYDAIPEEEKGLGWFDYRMTTFHVGVNFTSTIKFSTVPRNWDKSPADVPFGHPLRAIACLLDHAATDSTIRIFCYCLTDPMALDLIIHHANEKIMKVIIHPNDYTIQKIQEFLKRFERFNSWDVFFLRMQVRVANTSSPPCSKYSSMHDKRVISSTYCTYGSYNLSCAARFANREAIAVVDTDSSEIDEFERYWVELEDRKLEQVYNDFYPSDFRPPKHT